MTTLEIILIIILYIIGGTVTGIKISDMWEDDDAASVCSFITIFWPVTWIVRFIQAFFVDDWDW